MPKKPMDYSKTIIYKIVCKDENIKDCYVGHTTSFVKRKCQHKNCCNNENNKEYNRILYKTIRKNGGWDNWDMIEIERYDCKDIYEARKYEYNWIKELNAKLNYILPYDKEIKECIKEREYPKMKEYRDKNKDILKEKNKEWREANKEIIKEKKNEYYEKNKYEILEKNKEHYEKNKQKILEKQKEKIECECGSTIRKSDLARHKKTKKHIEFSNNQ